MTHLMNSDKTEQVIWNYSLSLIIEGNTTNGWKPIAG
jgi:hypothetical protein